MASLIPQGGAVIRRLLGRGLRAVRVAAPRGRRDLVQAVPVVLLSANYALALLLVKEVWFLGTPYKDYLTSIAGWPQLVLPLLVFVPKARVVPETLLRLFRRAGGGLRASALAGSLALSLSLGVLGPLVRPRIELRELSESIDGEASGALFLDEVDAPTVRADRLCVEPVTSSDEEGDCHAPLPARGYLRVRIQLGRNRLPAYRLQMKAEPEDQVAFARVRTDRAMGVGEHPDRVKTSGSELVIVSGERGSNELTGTVEIRVLCRWLPGMNPRTAVLHVRLARDVEGKEVVRELEGTWSLASAAPGVAGNGAAPGDRS